MWQLLLALIVCALLFVSCNKTGGSGSGTGSYDYPAGWPLAELGIPAGSTQLAHGGLKSITGFPAEAVKLHSIGHHTGQRSAVYFKPAGSYSATKQAIEQQLSQSGQSFYVKRDAAFEALYVSEDKTLFVGLSNGKFPDGVLELRVSKMSTAVVEEDHSGRTKL